MANKEKMSGRNNHEMEEVSSTDNKSGNKKHNLDLDRGTKAGPAHGASYGITEAIRFLKQGKKRNFPQSFDLIFNLKNIDLRKPENKFTKEILLPHGRGKDVEVGIISDSINGAITKSFLEKIGRKEIRSLIKKYEFFICEAPLMPFVGKVLGKFIGPTGKMPSPFPPNMKDVSGIVDTKKKSVRIKLRDSPLMQIFVGTENMADKELEENIRAAMAAVEKSLPKGKNQIKDVRLKMTMSPAVKVNI